MLLDKDLIVGVDVCENSLVSVECLSACILMDECLNLFWISECRRIKGKIEDSRQFELSNLEVFVEISDLNEPVARLEPILILLRDVETGEERSLLFEVDFFEFLMSFTFG